MTRDTAVAWHQAQAEAALRRANNWREAAGGLPDANLVRIARFLDCGDAAIAEARLHIDMAQAIAGPDPEEIAA
jgi:hypothetical protein